LAEIFVRSADKHLHVFKVEDRGVLFGVRATLLYFFFQAEDGIRDFHVTGVQTCALPISPVRPSLERADADAEQLGDLRFCQMVEIGRASCRERVKNSVGGVGVKKNIKYRIEKSKAANDI